MGKSVLILVLVEVTLWGPNGQIPITESFSVLILVLVEVTLWALNELFEGKEIKKS